MLELNRVYCGDCLDLIKKVDDKSVDSIITDPPYFLGVTHNGKKGTYSDLAIMKPFFDSLFFQYARVLKDTGCMYMCCDWRIYPFLYPLAEQYLTIRNNLIWHKHPGQGPYYIPSYECVLFAAQGTQLRFPFSNVIEGIAGWNNGCKDTKYHDTQKPVALFKKFILDSTEPGDLVLDTFAGSGTLGVAAIQTGRNFLLFELQEKYCKVCKDRIAQCAGEGADIENYKRKPDLFEGTGEERNNRGACGQPVDNSLFSAFLSESYMK